MERALRTDHLAPLGAARDDDVEPRSAACPRDVTGSLRRRALHPLGLAAADRWRRTGARPGPPELIDSAFVTLDAFESHFVAGLAGTALTVSAVDGHLAALAPDGTLTLATAPPAGTTYRIVSYSPRPTVAQLRARTDRRTGLPALHGDRPATRHAPSGWTPTRPAAKQNSARSTCHGTRARPSGRRCARSRTRPTARSTGLRAAWRPGRRASTTSSGPWK